MYIILFILIFVLLYFILSKKSNNISKYLVMYSGGLDSLFVLYNLLQNGKNVHVHHIILIDDTDRWESELKMVRDVVKILKEKYNFDYTESTSSYAGINKNLHFTMDTDTTSIVALHMALINQCDAIATGHLPPERRYYDRKVINGVINLLCDAKGIKEKPILIEFPKLKIKNRDFNERNLVKELLKNDISKALVKKNESQNKFEEYADVAYDIYRYKLAEYLALPSELRDLYTGCRFPKIRKNNINFCGKCINCKYRDLINSSS